MKSSEFINKKYLEESSDEKNSLDDIVSAFVSHYKDDPMGMFMHAKSSYLDAISSAKNFSTKAAELNKSHQGMTKQEFQVSVLKHFGPHLKNHGFPKHASEDWGAAEQDMMKSLTQGVAEGSIDEMALQTYKTMGDFSKPGPFTGTDKKLVPHPKNIEKATRFFEKTPFDFRLFFSHLKGTGKYSEHGPMTPDEIRKVFGQDSEEIINGSEDAITVVYVGNKGDSKVMLSPWMMAHRFGHAIQAGARNQRWHPWVEAEKYFFQTINSTLAEHYGKVDSGPSYYMGRPKSDQLNYNLTPEYNALFNAIGTQRSSKSGQIRRPYEFLYELFAQYLGTGKVTLNPLPTNLTYGRKVWGNPTKYMNIKPEYRDELSRKTESDRLAHTMELLFNDVLSDSVGKIFVM